MANVTCKIEVGFEIDDSVVTSGHNLGDIVRSIIGDALNGSDLEWESITDISITKGD